MYAATRKNISKTTITGIKDAVYTGKNITQPIVVTDGKKVLVLGKDYTLTYKNNKSVGTAKVTITGKGNYTASVNKTFKINPSKCSLTQVKQDMNQVNLSWKKNTSADGYQIYIKQDKADYKELVTLNNANALQFIMKGVAEDGVYCYKIRAYKVVNKAYYYGEFSKEEKITYKATKGSIKELKTSDSSLEAPKNIQLVERKGQKTTKNDLALMWDYDANISQSVYVAYYDANDNLLYDSYTYAYKEEEKCYVNFGYDKKRTKDYTVKTIVIAPHYYDNMEMKYGKLVEFNCNVEVKVKGNQALTAVLKPSSWGQENINGANLPGTYEAGSSYDYLINYAVKGGSENVYRMSDMNFHAWVEDDGRIEISCYTDNDIEGMTSSQRALDPYTRKQICIYSDLKITGDNEASITANFHELNIVKE